MTTANAVRISGYGSPDVLAYGQVDLPPLRPDEVRIKTIASAVNYTDLEIRAGHWPIRKEQPFPYVPGVEVVGEIVEVGADAVGVAPGDRVITMMQGLGGVRAERPGGYAEFVTVAADAVASIGASVDPYVMAALGLGALTAYEGLRRIGDLAGKRILVTGAAGGVGSSAVAIARAQGATVVGVVTRGEQSDYVRSLGADEVVVAAHDAPVQIEAASADGILDTVGAPLFAASLQALKPRRGLLACRGGRRRRGALRPLGPHPASNPDGLFLRELGWQGTKARRSGTYRMGRDRSNPGTSLHDRSADGGCPSACHAGNPWRKRTRAADPLKRVGEELQTTPLAGGLPP